MPSQPLDPNRTYDFRRPERNRCVLDVEGGWIGVTPATGDSVRVICRIDPASSDKYRFAANEDDGTLVIEGRRTSTLGGDFGVQVIAQVPTDCVIELRVAGGSIEVGRHNAAITAHVSGGSLRIERAADTLVVVAAGGSVAADEVAGSVRVQARGGSVRLGSVAGSADVDIKGGSLRIALTGQPDARLRTQAGDIKLTVPDAAGFKLLAGATAGRVKIKAPLVDGGFDGTTFSGAVNGGGATTVDAQTSAGNIILEAAGTRTGRLPDATGSGMDDAAAFGERALGTAPQTRTVPGPPRTDSGQIDVYFDRSGREITLVRQPGKIAVRFVRGRSVDNASLSEQAKVLLRTATPTTFVPEYALQVFEIGAEAEPGRTTRELRELNTQTDIQFATPVYRRSSSAGLDIFVNNQVVVELKDTTSDAEFFAFNKANHLTVLRPLGYGHRGHVLSTISGDGEFGPIEIARRFFESGLVIYATPDLIQTRVPRHVAAGETRVARNAVPTSWRYRSEQWHLVQAKIIEAWQVTQGVETVRVAIADDGVDTAHVEFAGRVVNQFDFSADVPDARPKLPSDRHGTACAGVAVAKGVAAYGAAPGCRLIAVRFPEQMGSVREGDMFRWMADNGADVISCSWGPPDGRSSYYPLPDNVASAIRHCLTAGRLGLGTPVFWASGNGNEQISTDGYAANPDVIAIGATTERDAKALYSDYGNELSLCAPSSGDETTGERGILTTDRSGGIGYNPDAQQRIDLPDADYTSHFGGTSSAAPLTAGVAALMLSVNPALTHLAIRRILEATADKVGTLPYDAQGRNGVFGFGRLNAKAAVDEALRQIGTPVQTTITAPPNVNRDGPPVEFVVAVPPGKYYAVEVATDPLLFGPQRPARSSSNFFASWASVALMNGPRYSLPADVWATLRASAFLFYRLLVSDTQQAWLNVTSTTPASNAAQAPSVKIIGTGASPQPTVTGPSRHSRAGGGPQFQVNPQPHFYYAFEVGTDPVLLTPASAALRNDSNYFATWNRAPSFVADPIYQLPDDVWQRLKGSAALHYRIIANGAGGRWQSPIPSTPNGAPLPSVELTSA